MNAVIKFPPNRAGKAARAEAAGPAEVIIFPGVRFERSETALPPHPWAALPALVKEIENA